MATSKNRISDTIPMVNPSDVVSESSDDALSDAGGMPLISDREAAALRQEKLDAIRRAVDAGVYDSDELLAKAMERMKATIENDNDRQ